MADNIDVTLAEESFSVAITEDVFTISIDGASGSDGADGTEIELQSNGTYIQWRYVGAGSWTNLVALSAITGATGAQGINIRGAYNSLTAYVVDDVVTHDGSAYHCTVNSQGNDPTNINYWGLLVAKGDSPTLVVGAGITMVESPAGTFTFSVTP